MGNDLCFLNTYREEPIESMISEKKDLMLFSFSLEATYELRKAGKELAYIDDHFTMALHGTLDRLAINLTNTWDEPLRDVLDYKGVAMGRLFTRDLSFYFKDSLKCFTIATKILKRFEPKDVYCSRQLPYGSWEAPNTMPIYTHFPIALEAVCREMAIPFHTIGIEENDQQYKKRRDERRFFDLAVKGRNTTLGLIRRFVKRKGPRNVLSILLKPGMFEMLNELGAKKDLTFIQYIQAADTFAGQRSSESIQQASEVERRFEEAKEGASFFQDLPRQFDPVKGTMEKDLEYLLKHSIPGIMREIDRIEEVLTSMDIGFLLCLEDLSPLAKARMAVAEDLGIPSGVVQHGYLPGQWSFPYTSPTGTYNFTWGPGFTERFTSEYFPEEKVKVTGITSVDIVYARPHDRNEVDKVRESFGIPKDQKVVVWATNPIYTLFTSACLKAFEEEIEGVFEVMKDRKETLVVKLHPNQRSEFYEMVAKKVGLQPVITKEHLSELLEMCDVLMAPDSTVGLQGLVLEKPFIYLNTQEIGDLYGYVKEGVALPVVDLEALPKTLDKVLYGEKKGGPSLEDIGRFLDRYAANRDGSGMQILVDTIHEILEKDQTDRK